MGVWAVIRVQDPPVQGHTQPAGKVKPLSLSSSLLNNTGCDIMLLEGDGGVLLFI